MGRDETTLTLLRDRYEAREELSRGTHGRVLRAFDHQRNRDVALKIRAAGTGADRERLLSEARTLLSLRPHAGIPVIREGFFRGTDYVLVTDWVEGRSLARVLADRGDPGLPPTMVVGYLAELAQALDHLHAHWPPVVHGDVKPDNAVLTPEGQVVLVDLGPGRITAPRGTSGYVAPEVGVGESPTAAADVYGLAATALALLTGSAPLQGDPSWEGLDANLAVALERGLRRGLALEPARRPGSAGEFVQRLRGALSGALPTGVVTFCLTDIEGSAALWDAHPQAMGEVIARSEAIVARAVEAAGGLLIKGRSEGDSSLSVFRRPTNAALAAVGLQKDLARQSWPDGIELRIRVALHTGQAELRDGDYSGTTLNRAARLRELARGGEILCSRATADLIADELPDGTTLAEMGERRLRSLSRPEFVYALVHSELPAALAPVRARAKPDSAEVVGEVSHAVPGNLFVGRQREWRELRAALDQSFRGRGQVLLLSGEAGIGKTRLAAELAALAARTSAQVLWGCCYEGDALPAFWPWVEVVRSLAERHPGERLRDALGAGAPYVAQIVPGVKEILPELETPQLLDAEAAPFHLFEAVTRLLLHFARDIPLVVILEDLHWADPASLRLLTFLAPRLTDASVLLVGTYRPVEATPDHALANALANLVKETVVSRVALDGLARVDVDAFIASTTGSRPSQALVRAVHKRTEGNPFFIIELLQLLETKGGVLSPEAVWASEVPAGVHDVVRQRIARLPEEAAQLLTVAAVVGEEFNLELVADCLDLNQQRALALVEAALLAGLAREIPHQPGWFGFSHALIRETLYEALTGLRRAYLHRQVGEVLEHELETAGGDIGLAELAHHFYRAAAAGVSEKALSYALRTADQAMERFAYDQAEEQLLRALELVEGLPPGPERSRRELSVQLRLAQPGRGQAVADFGEAATRAWELARDSGDASELMGSLWRRAVFQVLLGDYASAEELGRQLLRGADEFDPPTAWSGHLVLGVVMSNRGLLLGSLEHLERAIELADSSNDPLVVATPLHPAVIARGHAATVHWILGDNDTATRVTLDNLRFARQLPHPVSVVYAQSWAAVIEVLRGDAAMTRQRCEEAIALSSDQGLNLQADLCRVLRGWALAELGEPEVGATEIKESIEAQRALGFRVSTDFSLALLAQAQWRAGRVQEALATVEEALAEQQAVGTYQWRAELLRLKGELLWALSPEHAGEAESNVLQAIAVAREQQAASLTARAEASLRRLVGR